MNELVGKFAQKQTRYTSKLVGTREEIDEIDLNTNCDIEDFSIEGETCHLLIKNISRGTKAVSRRSNVIIAAYVTSYNRVLMHQNMLKIDALGGTLFYISTDSLCYCLNKDIRSPLDYGLGTFGFKSDYLPGRILSFYSLGPKQTCITHQNDAGAIFSVVKVRGINLSSLANEERITPDLLSDFLKDALGVAENGKERSIRVSQRRYRRVRDDYVLCEITFNNDLARRRLPVQPLTQYMSTKPFGMKTHM